MKILHVIASMNPQSGGTSQGIRNTAAALLSHKIETEVVCVDDPGSNYLGSDLFEIHALGPANNPWSYSPKLSAWLNQNLSRFDRVITNGLWLHTSLATLNSVRNVRNQAVDLKWYVMPHGMLDPYFQKAKERKWKALRNLAYWKLIESKVVNAADGVLFTAEEEMHLARTTFSNYRPLKEINIGYGVQQPPLQIPAMANAFFAVSGISPNEPFWLFLGRIHPKKGIANLIKAYLSLCADHAETALPKMVLAGPGYESQFGKQMKELAHSDDKMKNQIVFVGMVEGYAKWGAFYTCEAFLLPSHQENFGIAVVEALACGKPVLISDKVNIWREIADGRAGLVQSDSELGTLALLKEWMEFSEKEKNDVATNALKVFKKHFSMEATIDRWVHTLNGKVLA